MAIIFGKFTLSSIFKAAANARIPTAITAIPAAPAKLLPFASFIAPARASMIPPNATADTNIRPRSTLSRILIPAINTARDVSIATIPAMDLVSNSLPNRKAPPRASNRTETAATPCITVFVSRFPNTTTAPTSTNKLAANATMVPLLAFSDIFETVPIANASVPSIVTITASVANI